MVTHPTILGMTKFNLDRQQYYRKEYTKAWFYQSLKLTIHSQLELRLNFVELYISTPHMPSGQAQEQLYLYNAAC